MRRVQLQHLEAGGVRTPHRRAIRRQQIGLVALADWLRLEPAIAERLLGRRDDRPRSLATRQVFRRERPVAIPGTRHARLAAGVRELDAGQGTLTLYERCNSGKPRDVRIIPDAAIAVRDAPARLDRGRLDEDDAGAALRKFSKVYQMPVGDMPIARRVLAHRRDDDAIARRQLAQRDRLEEERRIRGQGRIYFLRPPP